MISDSSINAIRKFVAERDWSQFHTPGNLAKSISIEAAELWNVFNGTTSHKTAISNIFMRK